MEAWTIMEIEATKERLHNEYGDMDSQDLIKILNSTWYKYDRLSENSPYLKSTEIKINVLQEILDSRGYIVASDGQYKKNIESKS